MSFIHWKLIEVFCVWSLKDSKCLWKLAFCWHLPRHSDRSPLQAIDENYFWKWLWKVDQMLINKEEQMDLWSILATVGRQQKSVTLDFSNLVLVCLYCGMWLDSTMQIMLHSSQCASKKEWLAPIKHIQWIKTKSPNSTGGLRATVSILQTPAFGQSHTWGEGNFWVSLIHFILWLLYYTYARYKIAFRLSLSPSHYWVIL